MAPEPSIEIELPNAVIRGRIGCRKAGKIPCISEFITGIDFNDTFSLTEKLTTVRIIAAIAVRNNWELEKMDMDAAFRNVSLKEEIYMHQPRGFEAPGKEDKVIHLKWATHSVR